MWVCCVWAQISFICYKLTCWFMCTYFIILYSSNVTLLTSTVSSASEIMSGDITRNIITYKWATRCLCSLHTLAGKEEQSFNKIFKSFLLTVVWGELMDGLKWAARRKSWPEISGRAGGLGWDGARTHIPSAVITLGGLSCKSCHLHFKALK